MKSFIRSHKQPTPIEPQVIPAVNNRTDGNNSKDIASGRRNSHFENPLSTISSNNSTDSHNIDPLRSPKKPVAQGFSTPPPIIYNSHHSPSRHSPTFESFHKLANKTHKLFKRTSNSNLRSSIDLTKPSSNFNSFEHNTTNNNNKTIGTNTTSSYRKKNAHSSSSLPSMDIYNNDPEHIPVIKGTITHSWGSNNKRSSLDSSIIYPLRTTNSYDARIENQVIYLNAINDDKTTTITTTDNKGDLKPAVQISKKQASEPSPSVISAQSSIQKIDALDVPKQRVNRSTKSQRYKNRQARIHSNEDLLNLQVNTDSKPQRQAPVKNTTRIPTITIQEPTKTDKKVTENNSDENSNTNSESDSDTSEFSFEYSGLNGRTSSVKYYSKPEDEEGALNNEKIYINDIYEDENFDEDMNYDDDYDFHDFTHDKDDLQSVSPNDSSENIEKKDFEQLNFKKYSDMFDTYSEDRISPDFSFDDTVATEKKLEQTNVNEIGTQINKYSDLFDISDDDAHVEEEGQGNMAHRDDNDDIYPDPSQLDSIYTSLDGKTHKSSNCIDEVVNTDTQSIINVPTQKSFNKGTEKITSYNDLFGLPDDNDEDDMDNYKAQKQDDHFYEQGDQCQNPAVQNPNSSVSVNNLKDKNERALLQQVLSSSLPKTTIKQVSKYSDLFDLSDDDDDNNEAGFAGVDAYDEDSDIPTQSNSPSNSIPEERSARTRYNGPTNGKMLKSSLSITTNFNQQLLNVKPIKKPFIRSYKNFPIISDDCNDGDDTEDESLTPLTFYLDVSSPLNSRHFTPVRNHTMSPPGSNIIRPPIQPIPHISTSQPLPPTARSNILKYHDLNSNLDSDVPGLTSTLYFIDEAEEDEYNNHRKEPELKDDIYNYDLDEINTVPEDFEFSEADLIRNRSRNLRSTFGSPLSFRRTHSYHGKPIGISRENTPVNNRLEINNKTVTFFNPPTQSHNINNTLNFGSCESRTPPSRSPLSSPLKVTDDSMKFFSKPSPEYASNSQYSLSPIQESSSTTSSPERK